jgi:hypothetical protein
LADANKEQVLRDEAVTEIIFARCLLLLKVNASPCLFISTLVTFVILADILLSSFVVQVLPEYLHRLCSRAMILC